MSAPLLTVAEGSTYRRTSRHREVLEYLARLAERSDRVRVVSMGASGLGQDMPCVVLGPKGCDRPETARASGLPIVLVVANIHAGEVEGKESCLALARDLSMGSLAPLCERAVVLLVPDYNPDGNDLIDPGHRALDLARLEGQIGPEGGVGTRYTGAGWNLNRDYTKQDAVETRHLAALLAAWMPHVVVDCHTTDGSIHGYDLTYDTSRNLASCPAGPAVWARDRFLPEISRGLRSRTGSRTWFYGNFRDADDPASGWESYPPLARYGSHYRGLLGGVDVLLEAYSYIDFRARCDVMAAILVEILARSASEGAEIVRLVDAARADVAARGRDPRPGDLVGIDYGTAVRDAGGRLSFRHPGAHTTDVDLDVWDLPSTRARTIPGRMREVARVPFLGRYDPTVSVARPFAYLVPRERTSVIEKLSTHRLRTLESARESSVRTQTYRVVAREPTASPDVGTAVRTETVFTVEAREVAVTVRPGDVIVPMDQPWANLAVYLLEPHSDDGLARWGHFDDVAVGADFPVRRIPRPIVLPGAP